MPRINKKALTTELAKRGFESIAVKRELPDGRVTFQTSSSSVPELRTTLEIGQK